MIEILSSSPDIELIKARARHIKVKFKRTGIVEHWATNQRMYTTSKFRTIPLPQDPLANLDKKPVLLRQFEINPYYEEEHEILKNHFIIPKEKAAESNFINLRAMFHRLIAILYKQDWVDLTYTDEILKNDFDILMKSDFRMHQTAPNRFLMHNTNIANNNHGNRLLYHFTPLARGAAQSWRNRPKMFAAINRLLYGHRELTRENLVGSLNTIKSASTNYHRIIFTRCLQNIKVIDFYPICSSRMLAASLSNVNYYQPYKELDNCFSRLADFCNIRHIGLDNNDNDYDVALISQDRPLEAEKIESRIERYKDRAKTFMFMVSRSDKAHFEKNYKMIRSLRVINNVDSRSLSDKFLITVRPIAQR